MEPPLLEGYQIRALSNVKFLLLDMLTDNAVSAIELARNGGSTQILGMLEKDSGMLQSVEKDPKQITHSILGSQGSTSERHSYHEGHLMWNSSFAVL